MTSFPAWRTKLFQIGWWKANRNAHWGVYLFRWRASWLLAKEWGHNRILQDQFSPALPLGPGPLALSWHPAKKGKESSNQKQHSCHIKFVLISQKTRIKYMKYKKGRKLNISEYWVLISKHYSSYKQNSIISTASRAALAPAPANMSEWSF